jgi:ribonuclease Y
VDYLKRFNIPQPIIDCVAQHHEDEQFTSVESMLVYIADAISGARPGARYEDYEEYVKRIQEIEDLVKSFKGIKETYALQAGREIRVIVKPEELTDAQTVKLTHDLKAKIEKKLTYPGTIKVTAIREFRQIDIAK